MAAFTRETRNGWEVVAYLLDLRNPRISGVTSQHEAIQKIIEDQDVKLVKLAESIVDEGRLNPMDRFLVMEAQDQRNKFIVVEGNRRLAALMILGNPNVLSGLDVRPSLKKALEGLSQRFDSDAIPAVDCFVVKSREEAAPWIRHRHTGENEGVGIVDWSSVAQRRFIGNDPALQALEFVITHGGLSEQERKKVEVDFPITTLDRLLSTPSVRIR